MRDLSNYSDDELISLATFPKNLKRSDLNEIIYELRKRGQNERADEIEIHLTETYQIYTTFWPRVGSYIIDIMFLGVLGFIFGSLFFEFFSNLGYKGLLFGFLITLAYFGLGNSKIFNGQTLGKRAIGIQVIDSKLNTLSILKSISRSLIYTLPYFLLNYRIMGWSEISFSYITKVVLCLTFLIILPIHFLINTPTRQSLHDLIMGSYVVNTNGFSRDKLVKSRTTPAIIASFLALVLICLFTIFNLRNLRTGTIFQELKPLKEHVDSFEGILNTGVTAGQSSFGKLGGDSIERTKFLRFTVQLNKNLPSDLKYEEIEKLPLVKEIVKTAFNEYSEINTLDQLQIVLVYGYNLGISKSSRLVSFSNPIDKWKEKIE